MKHKKDIALLCQFFYPEYVSSATLPFDTALALQKSGYQVDVICGFPKEYSIHQKIPKKEIYQGIAIKRVRYMQLSRKALLGRTINYLSFIFCMIFNIPSMSHYKIILVYSNPPFLPLIAIWAKKIYGCKVIFVSYDVYPEIGIKAGKIKENSFAERVFAYINIEIARNADKIVAVSKDMQRYLQRHRTITDKKIVKISNWYNNELLQEKQEGTLLKEIVDENDFLLSYLGNLGTCQDIETMLGVMKQLQNFKGIHFLVAGHGNKMEYLRKTISKDNLTKVHIFPFLLGDEYKAVLARSDAFVVTLIPGLKGLCAPSKTYSYFMAAKPVFAVIDSQMEIAQDIINHECGYVIPHEDIELFSKKIIYLKEHPEKKKQMGSNSRQVFIEKYEKEVCLEKYIDLIKEEMGNV